MLIGWLAFRISQPAGRTGSAAFPPLVVRKVRLVSVRSMMPWVCTYSTVQHVCTSLDRGAVRFVGSFALPWQPKTWMSAECGNGNGNALITMLGLVGHGIPQVDALRSLRIPSTDTFGPFGEPTKPSPLPSFPIQLLTAPYSKIDASNHGHSPCCVVALLLFMVVSQQRNGQVAVGLSLCFFCSPFYGFPHKVRVGWVSSGMS